MLVKVAGDVDGNLHNRIVFENLDRKKLHVNIFDINYTGSHL